MGKQRSKIPYQKSKKLFRATADRTHKMNVNPRPMRGGTRM